MMIFSSFSSQNPMIEIRFVCLRSESAEISVQNSTSPSPCVRSNLLAAIFINFPDRWSCPLYAGPNPPRPMMLSS
ncbi:hypothetical protein HanXRQr2_Chr11g0518051 [Helianthus annuus]|uniref:Uncharacterized protein n=1 Tax=Helianthus annuus TaxID=4232 RepID=A0A9K3N2C8_HELAN|nr:hypothetical protein HanXRQr2_Chr11g0518051 [Helianthus annuus]KAJ0877358.1 hypothetical protein HanPSC8_Chr11g0499221 [Helianthus annuus]